MISLEQVLSFDCVHRWGWTLLHSLWQLTIAGAVLAVLLRILHRRTARTRATWSPAPVWLPCS